MQGTRIILIVFSGVSVSLTLVTLIWLIKDYNHGVIPFIRPFYVGLIFTTFSEFFLELISYFIGAILSDDYGFTTCRAIALVGYYFELLTMIFGCILAVLLYKYLQEMVDDSDLRNRLRLKFLDQFEEWVVSSESKYINLLVVHIPYYSIIAIASGLIICFSLWLISNLGLSDFYEVDSLGLCYFRTDGFYFSIDLIFGELIFWTIGLIILFYGLRLLLLLKFLDSTKRRESIVYLFIIGMVSCYIIPRIAFIWELFWHRKLFSYFIAAILPLPGVFGFFIRVYWINIAKYYRDDDYEEIEEDAPKSNYCTVLMRWIKIVY